MLLGLAGCQQSPATVSGTATLDGKPIAIQSGERGTVVFQPVSGQGSTATGLLDSTGHFKLATGGSSSIAPGKYQVAISMVRMAPSAEGAEQGATQVTPAKYSSPSTSGFAADVLPTANQFTFDLKSVTEEGAAATDGGQSPANSPGTEQPSSSGVK